MCISTKRKNTASTTEEKIMSNHPGPGIERAKIIQDIADRNTIIQKYIIGNHFCRQFFRSPIDLSGNRILGNIFINLIRNNFR